MQTIWASHSRNWGTRVADDSTISPRGSLAVLAASGVAALSTIIVTILSARVISVAANTEFIAYWSLLFGLFQVVSGIQNEATRAVGSLDSFDSRDPGRQGARVITMPLIFGGALAILAGVIAAIFGGRMGAGLTPVVIVVSMVVIVGYSCHLTIIGTLAGRHQWNWLAGLNAAEAIVRVAVMAVIGLSFRALSPLQLAAALPGLTWLLIVLWARPIREAVAVRTALPLMKLLRNGFLAIISSLAMAVLVNGFPAIVRLALAQRLSPDRMAPLLVAIQLTRAPLMIPLVAFQGVAIAAFVARPDQHLRALAKPLVLIVGIGIVAAAFVGWLGPWLIALLYGSAYQVSWFTCAFLTVAAISLASLTLIGAATIAISEHRAFALGWLVAAIVTVVLLWLPVPPLVRPAVAVFFGPLAGIVIQLWAIIRHDSHRAAGR